MISITGLDDLTKQLNQAQQALSEMDGDLGSVSFDPNDPASIESAIQQAEALVDSRLAPWADNALVAQLADQVKEQCRSTILEHAAEARLEGASE
ncbi:MAG: hypothetical protein R3F22_02885 [Lysobacteraceae bacterium]